MGPKAEGLIGKVQARKKFCAVGGRFCVYFTMLAAVYLAVLLCVRLLGIVPDWFPAGGLREITASLGILALNLVSLAAAALALALAFHRRPCAADGARAIDAGALTDDLFLTATVMGRDETGYEPIVLGHAEERAPSISPRRIVPFSWARGAQRLAFIPLALLVAVLFLPRLDPFGRAEARELEAANRQKVRELRKATARRAEVLAKRSGTELSPEVKKATDELLKAFKQMTKTDKQGNMKRLTANQANLNQLWRRRGEMLNRSLAKTPMTQRFGRANAEEMKQLQDALKRGDVSAMKDKIEDLKSKAKQLAETKDDAEREKLASEIKRSLQELSDMTSDQMSSSGLQKSLEQALSQLKMSGQKDISSEALKGLQDSLNLSQKELDALAQNFQDMKALEDALKTLQTAKQLNNTDPLDAQQGKGCQCMKDYADLYNELMGNCPPGTGGGPGEGQGEQGGGMRGPGIGTGGQAPEDDSLVTNYKSEKSRSTIVAGKKLLEWKTRTVEDPGQAVEDYRSYVKTVKDGVGEAMLSERVPPGYRDAIKKYFDSLGGEDGTGAGD